MTVRYTEGDPYPDTEPMDDATTPADDPYPWDDAMDTADPDTEWEGYTYDDCGGLTPEDYLDVDVPDDAGPGLRLPPLSVTVTTDTGTLTWTRDVGFTGDENSVRAARSSSLDGETVGQIMLTLAVGYIPSPVHLLLDEHQLIV
ncbi:hypothetical protein P5W04_10290 [Mycobacteroides abscessus subsp. abscessus]|uniref:hypothetical protein n=1 Tax=Mycobacteroides abscessus TaxID=36809 RepID=UPI001603123E|nr:hypothetical protein [Mycobacteroides abscessus]MBN7484556.1 hypothetical protein [Mycobacteroides abscessus subsp. abscessus]MDO3240503.1 hypothetical protein [Mycobacteroides abscessus subsp. abscessus]